MKHVLCLLALIFQVAAFCSSRNIPYAYDLKSSWTPDGVLATVYSPNHTATKNMVYIDLLRESVRPAEPGDFQSVPPPPFTSYISTVDLQSTLDGSNGTLIWTISSGLSNLVSVPLGKINLPPNTTLDYIPHFWWRSVKLNAYYIILNQTAGSDHRSYIAYDGSSTVKIGWARGFPKTLFDIPEEDVPLVNDLIEVFDDQGFVQIYNVGSSSDRCIPFGQPVQLFYTVGDISYATSADLGYTRNLLTSELGVLSELSWGSGFFDVSGNRIIATQRGSNIVTVIPRGEGPSSLPLNEEDYIVSMGSKMVLPMLLGLIGICAYYI
eukprot:TRINITY_DN19379_c0_g1_i1.p1 TRINITY_DN19379_c0_g1~~TRINITY_DN19379_c0_g1_i1.p1  ORF type:complete len:323 (+),score=36.56 TRINITY_DN19379_c0_g1_i1:46-1014(+)